MNSKSLLFACAALFAAVVPSVAQTFQEGFFLDQYSLGHRLNPALAAPSDFVSVGQISKGSQSNYGVSAFQYPVDGEILSGLNARIPAETFLGNLHDDNYTLNTLDYNLFTWGFRRGEAFHTVEVNAKGSLGYTFPKEIFKLLKEGTSDAPLDLSGAGGAGRLYAEIAYGYSRRFGDFISVGARAKLLLGVYGGGYRLTRVDLKASDTAYTMDIDAELDLTDQSLLIHADDEGYLDFLHLTRFDARRFPGGVGLAADLGVVVTPADGLTLSASLLDLGGMFWSFGNAGRSSGSFTFTGVRDLTFEEMNMDGLVSQAKAYGKELLAVMKLKKSDDPVRFEAVPFTVTFGAKYAMPFYDRLSVGLSGVYTRHAYAPYRDVRLGIGVRPLDWLDMAVDFGKNSYGPAMGCAVSLQFGRFGLVFSRQDNLGPRVPRSHDHLNAYAACTTFGLTCDL